KSEYTADMTAYIVEGEFLNNLEGGISKPIGSIVYLPKQPGSAVENHSMKSVKEAIKEWKEAK
ncbi:hypothetical protein, partial [Clostridium sp.]|uniref:hypothetical protein n=1 Tax=Clostridium sp. TaxID=1506 RepID=UPI0026185503